MADQSRAKSKGQGRSLVKGLVTEIRSHIESGKIRIGDKLPSEAALTEKHGVSRTVVREAVAALRSEGLVQSRQGAGVFVVGTQSAFPLPFDAVNSEKLSSLVEMMEFRIAVEAESAALAAQRRSLAQAAKINEALQAFDAAESTGSATGPLDLEFHLSVAQATNNPRFEEFLKMLGSNAIPRSRLAKNGELSGDFAYQSQLKTEHHRIASAILSQNSTEARLAMHEHLENGMLRYQKFLAELE